MRFNLIIVILFLTILSAPVFDLSAADGEEFLSFDLEVENVFEMTLDVMIDPDYTPPDPASLASPSTNVVVPGLDLGTNFDFGSLLRLKAGGEVHLVSEYKIRVNFSCYTNTGHKYNISQYLSSPITGKNTGALFPQGVFVTRARFTPEEGNDQNGIIYIPDPVPVSISDLQKVYTSDDYVGDDLSNFITAEFWFTDNCATPLKDDQAADTYRAVIVFTMTEEL